MECQPRQVLILRDGGRVVIGSEREPPRSENEWLKPSPAVFCKHGQCAVLATAGGKTRDGKVGINWTVGDVREVDGRTVFTPNQLRQSSITDVCDLFQDGRMIPDHSSLQELLIRRV